MSETVPPLEPGPSAASASSPSPGPTASEQRPSVPVLPPDHWAREDLGPTEDDDSALGDEKSDSAASLSSSILHYRTIHGRRYHSERGEAQYWGANDEGHSESLDILHHCYTLCLGDRLYLAPIKDPKRALDIGTGTGLWAIDFADEFPGCEVVGTDISPIQPTWVPPNLRFEIEDCTQEWTFASNTFDYVHTRALVGSIADWSALFREAFRVLKPGGYLESYEMSGNVGTDDGPLPPTSAVAQWGPLFVQGGRAIGRSFTVVDDGIQRKAMEEAGFVDIQEKNIKCPTGAWPKDPKLREIGRYSQLAVLQDVEGFILFLTTVLNWTREQVQVYIAHLRRELKSEKYHVYYWQKVVWGRKPEA
ncbi:hypothetical protein VTK73DRAFT_10164 [Phialemonium thermophilum]|uniref:Methyltransferase domain-containing protein n=1 Tax=Phialemonium thermophilum TaxID=223376 RepID=A0ABR3VY86_9PEZI